MRHLDDGTIQALLHGELSPHEQAEATGHEAACALCRAAVRDARSEDAWVRGRLAVLDRAPPAGADTSPRLHHAPRSLRWSRAATALFLLGAASLAMAMPAVRGMVTEWLGASHRDAAVRVPAAAAPAQVVSPETSGGSGISVVPGTRFTVHLAAAPGTGTVYVRVVEQSELSVRASAGNVSLESQDDALFVRNPGGVADYYVEVPRATPRVEVRSNGARVALVQHGVIAPAGPTTASGWTSYPIR